MKTITITTEYIKLQDLLKFANLVATCCYAKERRPPGSIPVPCAALTRSGDSRLPGDDVAFQGQHYTAAYAD